MMFFCLDVPRGQTRGLLSHKLPALRLVQALDHSAAGPARAVELSLVGAELPKTQCFCLDSRQCLCCFDCF